MEKDCKHNYVSEKRKVNTTKVDYVGGGRSEKTPLEQEELFIFCTKCGDAKKIS